MKIRYKVLLLFLLVAMVPLLLSSVWAIYTLRNHQVAATKSQQDSVSQIVSDKISAFVRAKAEKFVIQVKRNSDYDNDEFWKAVNFLLQESDFGFEII